jgi:hypothetical protein
MAKHRFWVGHSPGTGILQCFAKTKNPSTSISCGLFRADYFHLVNSHESIPDDIGIEVSDLTKAEEVALQAIENIREEAIQQGASWQGWRLDIVDLSGCVLLSIPLDPTFH